MGAGTSFREDDENVEKLLALGGNSPEFPLMVSMGKVRNAEPMGKFGVNLSITTSTDPEDIIEQGGRVQWDTDGTAPIKYISSSDALDTGQTIEIQGLDINGNFVSQIATTNGQTNVVLETPLWRNYRMSNESPNTLLNGDIQGTLYCHSDAAPTAGVPTAANIRTIITAGTNQTLFCAYTVPNGKVGFIIRGEVGLELEGNAGALAEYVHFHYELRTFGMLFKVKKAVSIVVGGSGSYADIRTFPDSITGKSDIVLVADSVSTTIGVWGTFDMLIVDESEFSTEYLTAIGQPGY